MKTFRWFGFFILLVLLTSCSSIVQTEQEQIIQTTAFEAGQSTGQTFTAAYDGLTGIEVYLVPNGQQFEGEIRLYLRSSPISQQDISQSVLSLAKVTNPGYYRFYFPKNSHSGLEDYYFGLELTDADRVELGSAQGDTYLDGAQYADGQPVDAQLAFRLVYDPLQLLTGLFHEGVSWLGILIASCFLFILPGWALLSWVLDNWTECRWLEKVALSAGVSVALYPVLFLWAKLFHLRLGAMFAWGPPVIALLYIIWKYRKMRLCFPKVVLLSTNFFANLAVLIFLTMIVFIRMWVVRELHIPMWGDSYQHTVLAQLIVDNGGLFDNWLPYADLYSLTYHYGFQSLVAVFHWITGVATPQATLWTGQILNVLAVLAIVPLALKCKRSPWVPVIVLLVAGLFSPMPMSYTNWGRYTQLTGQVILPIAVWLVWEMAEVLPRSLKSWVLLAVVWAGLALTHYRVFLIGGLFLLVLTVFLNTRLFPIRRYARFAVTGMIGAILLLPWLFKGYTSGIVSDLMTKLNTPAVAVSQNIQEYNAIGLLSSYAPTWLWVLSLISLGFLLWMRNQKILVLTAWAAATLIASNPSWINLPGDGVISNFALFIFAYFWLAILVATALSHIIEAFMRSSFTQPIVQISFFVLLLVVGAAHLPIRRADVQLKPFQLFTRADERAARWIQQNTPEDATFLVNSMFAYGDSLIVGTDGGWWLPLITGRNTTVPPLIYGVETGPFPDYIRWINTLSSEIYDKGIVHPNVVSLIRERNITHLYIGQRQGSVNYAGPELLDPEIIRNSPDFRLIYHQDRVWIFSFQPQSK